MTRPLVCDVHTHVYTPALIQLMRERRQIPRIVKGDQEDERMLLLKEEVRDGAGASAKGRPVGPQYWDPAAKLEFMDQHGIDVSVVSLANPWLDFFESPADAFEAAKGVNRDLETYCSASTESSSQFSPLTSSRLFAFGSLPLVPGIQISQVLEIIEQIQQLSAIRGVVMGTNGLGKGLDDSEMEPIWEALSESGLVVFVHPHYGIGDDFGPRDNGHVLPLALGFPVETSIATTRLILAGLWYDAVAYGPEELAFLERVIARADNYEGREEELEFCDRVTGRKDFTAPEGAFPGAERILFGTDHPFFPPLDGAERWKSVDENLDAINGVPGWGDEEREKILGGNAVELFGLEQ